MGRQGALVGPGPAARQADWTSTEEKKKGEAGSERFVWAVLWLKPMPKLFLDKSNKISQMASGGR